MINLKLATIVLSIAEALSSKECHTRGKGVVIRWTIGTPDGRKGKIVVKRTT